MLKKQAITKIWIGKFGDNADRSFGFSIKSDTKSQKIFTQTFPIGFGRFVCFLQIKNKFKS